MTPVICEQKMNNKTNKSNVGWVNCGCQCDDEFETIMTYICFCCCISIGGHVELSAASEVVIWGRKLQSTRNLKTWLSICLKKSIYIYIPITNSILEKKRNGNMQFGTTSNKCQLIVNAIITTDCAREREREIANNATCTKKHKERAITCIYARNIRMNFAPNCSMYTHFNVHFEPALLIVVSHMLFHYRIMGASNEFYHLGIEVEFGADWMSLTPTQSSNRLKSISGVLIKGTADSIGKLNLHLRLNKIGARKPIDGSKLM